jgi:hypothetical protein
MNVSALQAPLNAINPVSLQDVLAPMVSTEFFNQYWGQSFVHVKGRPDKFKQLFPWGVLNRILSQHRLQYPRIRLVRDGSPVPVKDFMLMAQSRHYQLEIPRVNVKPFLELLRSGATLVIDSVDELHTPVTELARALEYTFHEQITVNLYAAWGKEKGFDVHWDEHDVLVLQIAGRKNWAVYGTTQKWPLTHCVGNSCPPPRALWSGLINEGDLLYLPRGWWHVARPLSEPSLHLTFGIRNRNGIDLLSWLATKLHDNELCRMDIPRFSGDVTLAEHTDRLRAAIIAAFDDGVTRRFLDDYDSRAQSRAIFSLPFSVTHPEVLPLATTVRMLVPRRLTVVANGQVCEMSALGRKWGFVAGAKPILEGLSAGRDFTVGELLTLASVTREQLSDLLIALMNEGILALLPSTASSEREHRRGNGVGCCE